MKRVFTLALALALLMSLVIPASAATRSVVGNKEDLLPEQVTSTDDGITMYSPEDFEELPEEVRETLADAKENLADPAQEDLVTQYFFYVDTGAEEERAAIFQPEDNWAPVVMQYVDDEWVKREVTVNEDGTITVEGLVDAPTAYMIQPEARVVSTTCDDQKIYTEQDLEELSRQELRNMEAAKDAIPEAMPEGMLIRHFFDVDVCETCGESTVAFEDPGFNDLVIMQYVNGEWIELEYTANAADGTVTVEGVVDGPMVFFVK